jgi:hypothetical protein
VTLGPRQRRQPIASDLPDLDPLESVDLRLERLKRDARVSREVWLSREDALRLPPRPKKRHRSGALVTLILFALAVTGVVLVARKNSGGHSSAAAKPVVTSGNDSAAHGATALAPSTGYGPPPGIGEKASRLLPVPPLRPALEATNFSIPRWGHRGMTRVAPFTTSSAIWALHRAGTR